MTSGDPSSDQDTRLKHLASQGVTPSVALGSLAAKPPVEWEPPAPEELQMQLPQYKILGLLGRGGMGAVYQGWQLSLDRSVAIKILPPGMDDGGSQFALRFKQEARTMAKFQHPGIVAVHDAGETTSGLLYIVMEFIEGTDVAQMVHSQGRLSADEVLDITMKVCDALHYAHSQGIIHRDIKPANIMLNKQGAVKVADFGLAKGNDRVQNGLTKTNMAMGTPDYVAPEALMGMQVDHRADLFAVGVMLYKMLTGEVPRGLFQMPSVKCGTDPRFDRIITKAMQTELDSRYQSALEIRRDLEAILSKPRSGNGGTPAVVAGSEMRDRRNAVVPKKSPSVIIGSRATLVITLSAAVVIAAGAFFAINHSGKKHDTTADPERTALLQLYAVKVQKASATAAVQDKPAFETEIKRLAGNEPLPSADDPELPAALQELRKNLREQLSNKP